MIDKLKEALITKEKTDYYLKNLEELKANNTVEENHYHALKDEYTKLREDAQAKIFSIKAQYKKMLDTEIKKLTTANMDLKYLEIRNKVGQLTSEEYLIAIKDPQRKCLNLEKKIGDLKKIIEVNYSHEIKQQGKFRFFGKKDSASGLADIPRITAGKQTEPKAADMAPEVAPPPAIELPPPLPPLPPQPVEPIPLPPPVVITTVSEEKLPEPELEPPPPPSLTVVNLEILPDRVEQGNQIGIIATLENNNDIDIQRVIDLKIDDKVADSCEVNLPSGENQEITFIITAQEVGERKVMLENSTRSFTVMPRAAQHK